MRFGTTIHLAPTLRPKRETSGVEVIATMGLAHAATMRFPWFLHGDAATLISACERQLLFTSDSASTDDTVAGRKEFHRHNLSRSRRVFPYSETVLFSFSTFGSQHSRNPDRAGHSGIRFAPSIRRTGNSRGDTATIDPEHEAGLHRHYDQAGYGHTSGRDAGNEGKA
jgi:hypothetical protein